MKRAMATIRFTYKQKFRQRLFHTGQILHRKQLKLIKSSIECCMSFNSAESTTFYTDILSGLVGC